jgi:hypothetical protein
MDDRVNQFMSITSCTAQKAESYLKVSDHDVEQAIQLFFETDGADIEAAAPDAPPLPARQPRDANNEPIYINDDDDMEDDDVRQAIQASEQHSTLPAQSGAMSYEDDEAMARRLQEELYGIGGGEAIMENGVRAPIAKTRETLLGSDDDDDFAYQPVRAGRVGWCYSRVPVPRDIVVNDKLGQTLECGPESSTSALTFGANYQLQCPWKNAAGV